MPPINIHVHETNQPNGENAGTFTEPHPKINVSKNANINFNILNPGATFKVRFNGFQSPFTSRILDIDQTTPAQTTSQTAGRYHYTIQVTLASGAIYSIENCPELDVG